MKLDDIKKKIPEAAKLIRKAIPLVGDNKVSTQQRVADRGCVARQAVSNLENGKIEISIERYGEHLFMFGVMLGIIMYPDPELKKDERDYTMRAEKCNEINCELLGLDMEDVRRIMEILEKAND